MAGGERGFEVFEVIDALWADGEVLIEPRTLDGRQPPFDVVAEIVENLLAGEHASICLVVGRRPVAAGLSHPTTCPTLRFCRCTKEGIEQGAEGLAGAVQADL